ncbi:ankyrin repeat domain-containing protein [Candidatus Dependentiae bacterium]
MKSILKKPLTLAVLLATLFASSLSLAVNNIFVAIKKGNLKEVKRLIEEEKVDVNKVDFFDKNPLYWACRKGNFEMVKYLLKNGANKSINKASYGKTPLYWACYNDNLEIVRLLLKNGAKESINKASYGETPLYWACYHNNLEMMKLLLLNGANKESINKASYGKTPLYWACYNDNLEIVRLLLKNSANKSINKATDKYGRTPLYWACWHNNLEIVKLLLKNDAKVDSKSKEEATEKPKIKKYFDLVEKYESLKSNKKLDFILEKRKDKKDKDAFAFLVRFAFGQAIQSKSNKPLDFFKKLYKKLDKKKLVQIFHEPYRDDILYFIDKVVKNKKNYFSFDEKKFELIKRFQKKKKIFPEDIIIKFSK